VDTLFRDLRHSVRSLRRTPGFTIAALLILALGIGMSTAMFTLFKTVLVDRIPIHAQDRVVVMHTLDRGGRNPNVPNAYLAEIARVLKAAGASRVTNWVVARTFPAGGIYARPGGSIPGPGGANHPRNETTDREGGTLPPRKLTRRDSPCSFPLVSPPGGATRPPLRPFSVAARSLAHVPIGTDVPGPGSSG
jgi:hypothetical protein